MLDRLRSAGPGAALFVFFAGASLFLYRGVLWGPLVNDDWLYLGGNPYTAALSWANLRAILDPFGLATFEVANYAPVHLLAHALSFRLFADWMPGYHVVNLLLHAGNATLLWALLRASRIPGLVAAVAAAFFLVHPANVEAVAWISQLKTCAALAFALGALLALRRHPLLATLFFALGLLSKAVALAALPAAAALVWSRRDAPRASWAWLGGWLLLGLAYALPQLEAALFGGQHVVAEFADPTVQLRTMAAAGARYLVMAGSGYGVGPFQEAPPVLSWTHAYWLAALPAAAVLGWRILVSLRRRREEAAWWLLAAAAFVPISQIVPFYFSIAARYLYVILPGLLGGALSWWTVADPAGGPPLGQRLPGDLGRWLPLVVALPLTLVFAHATALRAPLWTDELRLISEAARQYPRSGAAHAVHAWAAAAAGDVDLAVAHLDQAIIQGYLAPFEQNPHLASIRDTPEFAAMLRRQARWRLAAENARERTRFTPLLLHGLAGAHARLGERERARELLERGIRLGGPRRAQLLSDLLTLGRSQTAPLDQLPDVVGDR